MSLGPADSEPGGEPGQGEQSADDVPAWLAPGDAQGECTLGPGVSARPSPWPKTPRYWRVAWSGARAKEISKLAAGCHSSPVAGVTTAVSISVAATHAGTPAVSEINEQGARNATPERR
jgi:hypothetical protein